jgi:structural maintenance of chromosome 1
MRSVDRLEAANAKLAATSAAWTEARDTARKTAEAFDTVREKRANLFNKAFTHISAQIAPVYKALTRSAQFPLGGQAYLTPTGVDTTSGQGGAAATYNDDETPFLGGIKYHAMPPLKRFRDMDALSGGEKTIAALALLFAIHSFAPSPFFVLDEVDAALDNANVAKVARYIRENKGPGMQFIVISLKTGLFQESETLVGVLRDQAVNSSRAVTLDVSTFPSDGECQMLILSTVAEISGSLRCAWAYSIV